MISKFSKRHEIKIPKNITVIYSEISSKLLIKSFERSKVLKASLKLFIFKNHLLVTRINTGSIPNNEKKALKATQGTLISSIKQAIREVSTPLYVKLKLIGLGYKIFASTTNTFDYVYLRLGFSHNIYINPPGGLKLQNKNNTSLFISGHFHDRLSQFTSRIRSFRKPEPYKGKGVLHQDEKIKLKKGKKI